MVGRGSVVSLRTGRPGIESRWGEFFSAVQTVSESHPAFYVKHLVVPTSEESLSLESKEGWPVISIWKKFSTSIVRLWSKDGERNAGTYIPICTTLHQKAVIVILTVMTCNTELHNSVFLKFFHGGTP